MPFAEDLKSAREAFVNRDRDAEAKQFDAFAGAYRQSILTVAERWQLGTSEPSHLTNLGARLGIDSKTIQEHLALARKVSDLQGVHRRHARVRAELETVRREAAEPLKRLQRAEAAVNKLDLAEVTEADKKIATLVKQNPELFSEDKAS